MAFVAGEVMARLGLDLSRFTEGLGKAKAALGKFSTDAKSLIGFSLPSISIMGLATSSIHEAQAYQGAVKSLAMNLALAGNESQKTTRRLMEFGARMQSLYGVEDDVIIKSAAMAAQFGVSGDKLEQMLRGGIAMSKSFNMELSTAMWQITRGMNGMMMRNSPLRMLGVDFKSCTTEAQRFKAIMDKLGPLWKKVEVDSKSLSTGMARLSAAWGDMRKELGLSIINGLQLAVVYNWLATQMMRLVEFWQELPPWIKMTVVWGTALVVAVTGIAAVIMALVMAVGAMTAAFMAALPIITGIGSAFMAALPVLVAAIPVIAVLALAWAAFGDNIKNALKNMMDYMGVDWTEFVSGMIDGVQTLWYTFKYIIDNMVTVFKGLVNTLVGLGKIIFDFFYNIGHMIGSVISHWGEALGALLANPTDPKAMLDALKDIGGDFWDDFKTAGTDVWKDLKNDASGLMDVGFDFNKGIMDNYNKMQDGLEKSWGDTVTEWFKKSWTIPDTSGFTGPTKSKDEFTTVQAKLGGAYEKGSKEAYGVEKNSQFTALSRIGDNTEKTALAAADTTANTAVGNTLLTNLTNLLSGGAGGGGLEIPNGAA